MTDDVVTEIPFGESGKTDEGSFRVYRGNTRRWRTTGVVSQSYLPCADAFERPRHRLAAILSFLKPPVSR
jgi:hypothetical protein